MVNISTAYFLHEEMLITGLIPCCNIFSFFKHLKCTQTIQILGTQWKLCRLYTLTNWTGIRGQFCTLVIQPGIIFQTTLIYMMESLMFWYFIISLSTITIVNTLFCHVCAHTCLYTNIQYLKFWILIQNSIIHSS